jgi:putative spermidine/putrescine transport system substrate-binding protein
MKRRTFLLTGAAGLSTLAAPAFLQAQGAPLKVGTYGGYFQESFETHIFPDFTAETGIEVQSIAEPTGEAWLVQLEQAARRTRRRRTCP